MTLSFFHDYLRDLILQRSRSLFKIRNRIKAATSSCMLFDSSNCYTGEQNNSLICSVVLYIYLFIFKLCVSETVFLKYQKIPFDKTT